MTTHGSPIPPISRKPSGNHIAQLPQFLSVHQLVEVEEGSTAELECRLINLGSEHTVSSETVCVLYISLFQVSWLRCSDMSVLTVGGLVFSSEPRLGVAIDGSTVTLHIQEVTSSDSGDYQCQVNTDPKHSLDVTLLVTGPAYHKDYNI